MTPDGLIDVIADCLIDGCIHSFIFIVSYKAINDIDASQWCYFCGATNMFHGYMLI